MKMKNANFFQLHIEKILIGVAVLISLAILALYVIGSPYTATIENQEMGPRKVESYLQEKVQGLRSRLASTEAQFDPPQIAGYSQELEGRLATAPAPRDTFDFVFSRPGLANIAYEAPRTPFDIPRPPVAANLKAQASFALLGQQEDPQQDAQLIRLVGERTPRDVAYVSVEGEWPLKEWQTRLETSKLPTLFWRSMVGITSVYLQREELNPITGEWGNQRIVEPLPIQLGVTPGTRPNYTDEEALLLVQNLRQEQSRVARPDFPLLARGEWLPPSASFLNLSPEDQERIRKLRNDIARLDRQIEGLQRTLDRQTQMQQRSARAPRPTGRQPRGNFDDGGDFGDQPPAQRPGGPSNRTAEVTQELTRLTADRQRKQAEFNQLVGVPQDVLTTNPSMAGEGEGEFVYEPFINEMGEEDYREVWVPAVPTPARLTSRNPRLGAAQPATAAATTTNDVIRVWAHDLTVEPGKTYRYRLLVSVFNPLFRQTRVEETQRREFFNQVALGPSEREIAASPWSDPVHVDPEFHFFFLSGTAGQVANVEVWHVYNGVLHVSRFQESPGDRIGGEAKVEIDGVEQELLMQTDAVMIDLVASGGGTIGSDSRLLYFDPETETIASRSARQDENSPDRIRLQNVRDLQLQRGLSSASAAP